MIAGIAHIINFTEKPWEIDRTKPIKASLVEQVGICMLTNLGTAHENIAEAMRIAGLRIDAQTAADLVMNGVPGFGSRYNCFANLSTQEREDVRSSAEYQEISQFVILEAQKANSFFVGR